MEVRRRLVGVALALTVVSVWAAPASAQAKQRPLSDWLGPNIAEPVLVIWGEPGNPDWAYVDYFGKLALNNSLTLGSRFDGQVTERARKDGRADVHVVLHARNVLAYAYDTSQGSAIVFGHTAPQIKVGADPALADVLLTVDFINKAPGAPLPSLARLSFFPSANYTLGKLALVTSADGTFRAAYGVDEGTPGKMQITQRGIYDAPGIANSQPPDYFPAEHVNLIVTGR
jgi:hypothetical protein